jgi:hypothetical protein
MILDNPGCPAYITFQGLPASCQFAERAVLLPCRFIPVAHLSNYSSTQQNKTSQNKDMGTVT